MGLEEGTTIKNLPHQHRLGPPIASPTKIITLHNDHNAKEKKIKYILREENDSKGIGVLFIP